MAGGGLGLLIELIVSLLLVVTISYCFIVNRKLNALRADQSGLRMVIGELNRSSERAEQAILHMRKTAEHVEGDITGHIGAAHGARDELIAVIEHSRQARQVIEKLSEVDLQALRLVSQAARESALPNDQMKLAKQLKEQRLGFGPRRQAKRLAGGM